MTTPSLELAGRRSGKLVAVSRVAMPGKSRWLCRCDCGAEKVVRARQIVDGSTKSCGCHRREAMRAIGKRFAHAHQPAAHAAATTHGHARRTGWSRVYTAWISMRKRCNDPDQTGYADYGGRGIRVCERWASFENFLADMGAPPARHSLDRKDVDGNYEPSNCRWATQREQQLNKRNTVWVEVNGERLTLVDACERAGIRPHVARGRIEDGWSASRAVTTPLADRYAARAAS